MFLMPMESQLVSTPLAVLTLISNKLRPHAWAVSKLDRGMDVSLSICEVCQTAEAEACLRRYLFFGNEYVS